MGLTWDGGALNDAIHRIEALGEAPARIAQVAATKIADIIDQEFATEVDPNGDPWAAHTADTVNRWGPHSILDLTGAMKGSVQVTANGQTIEMRADDPVGFHQTGTVHMPARPVLPVGDEMPPAYELALQQAAAEVEGG